MKEIFVLPVHKQNTRDLFSGDLLDEDNKAFHIHMVGEFE